MRRSLRRRVIALVAAIVVAATSPASVASEGGELIASMIAADVTGDGRDEIVTQVVADADPPPSGPVDETTTLRSIVVRSGADGSVAWSMPSVDLGGIADLDGDGASELVAVRVEARRASASSAFAVEARHTVFVLDGATGTVRYSRRIDAVSVSAPAVTSRGGASADAWRDAAVSATPIADASGDGIADLLIGSLSRASADAGSIVAAGGTRYTARTIDVRAGQEIGVATIDSVASPDCAASGDCVHRIPGIVPAGDLDGDGRADLVGYAFAEHDAVLAAMTVGGRRLWTATLAGHTVWPSIVDATGDGIDDVVVRHATVGGDRLSVLDGTTGAAGWSRALQDGEETIEAGRIDDDTGTDFVLARTVEGRVEELRALAGATGETVWTRRIEEIVGEVLRLFLCRAADVNGDGAREMVVHGVPAADPGKTATALVSGRDGSTVYVTPPESEPFRPIEAVPRFDADGDGAADLLRLGLSGERVVVTALGGSTGSAMWSADAHVGTRNASQLAVKAIAAELDGDGAFEAIASVEDRVTGSTSLHAFGSGGLRWSARQG